MSFSALHVLRIRLTSKSRVRRLVGSDKSEALPCLIFCLSGWEICSIDPACPPTPHARGCLASSAEGLIMSDYMVPGPATASSAFGSSESSGQCWQHQQEAGRNPREPERSELEAAGAPVSSPTYWAPCCFNQACG